jgi:hypothetical protein
MRMQQDSAARGRFLEGLVPLTGRAGSNPASDTQLPAETQKAPRARLPSEPCDCPIIAPSQSKSQVCASINLARMWRCACS